MYLWNTVIEHLLGRPVDLTSILQPLARDGKGYNVQAGTFSGAPQALRPGTTRLGKLSGCWRVAGEGFALV